MTLADRDHLIEALHKQIEKAECIYRERPASFRSGLYDAVEELRLIVNKLYPKETEMRL